MLNYNFSTFRQSNSKIFQGTPNVSQYFIKTLENINTSRWQRIRIVHRDDQVHSSLAIIKNINVAKVKVLKYN